MAEKEAKRTLLPWPPSTLEMFSALIEVRRQLAFLRRDLGLALAAELAGEACAA
jgi:hypothetical protein